MKVKDLISLMRVRQWYKNLLIFLAIFFSSNISNYEHLYLTMIGFFALSFVSSANYIINDLIDIKKDQLHPEKKFRPLAAGKIRKSVAIILAILLLILALFIAYNLNVQFMGIVVLMFVITQIYTFYLKKIVFADILTIAILFVIRALSGAVLIDVQISPWLVLCPFFLSLFLSVGKRHSDILLMKEKSAKTRKVLKDYTQKLTESLMTISTTLLIISYALYSFLSEHQNLLYTLPFALFVIFRYYQLISNGSVIARHPEKVIKDKAIIIGILLWVIITAVMIYV
jgi:4-hydroxybenzoate polyprenyltransferase